MTAIRVLVGTRKGAFVLTGGRRGAGNWSVAGPHFAGWEIYHMKGSPADPDRVYASQSGGWFGQVIQRSSDGGLTWEQPGSDPPEQDASPGRTPRARPCQGAKATSSPTTLPMKPAAR